MGFTQEVVDGAGDFLRQSCSERVPPKLTSPGKLKEPKEFNEVITLDGFEWKNSEGTKFYVIHVFDEATHFHLGRRCQRGTEEAERVIRETWMHWAGPPQVIVHDLAGRICQSTLERHVATRRDSVRDISSTMAEGSHRKGMEEQ